MYLNHYNLKQKPFEISPDPKFLWLGEKHKEALAALKYGILENKGFMSLTGDVGTGKTTIVNALVNSLGDNIIFAQISDPSLEELDFFNLTADFLEMNKKFSSKGEFLAYLSHFLNNAYLNDKKVVLLIEEAQRLDQDLLEQIRLLSNIERPDKKLITIIFVGQIEFNSLLKNNRALRQRISVIYNIESLMNLETEKYIKHRLKVAGSAERIFSQGAIREIFSFSKGNPRLINIICDLALLTGYVKELKIIDPEIIKECAANFQLPNQTGEDVIKEAKTSANATEEATVKKVRTKPAGPKIASIASVAVIILACVFGYFYYFGDYNAFSINAKTFLEKAIDRFTNLKSEISFQKTDEIIKHKGSIIEPQVRQSDLKVPKTATEIQLDQLKTRYEDLQTELKALKIANQRVAKLETTVAQQEQMLSQADQKLAKSAQDLDQEKASKGAIQAELSSKVTLVAELQEQLETLQSKVFKSEGTHQNSANEMAELQEQLKNLKTQASSAETQLGQLRSINNELVAELEQLPSTKERIVELESSVVQGEHLISEYEQKLTELVKHLAQEKKSKSLIRTELLSKDRMIAEVQEKLAASESNALKFEAEIRKRQTEIEDLQGKLANLETQKAVPEPSPLIIETQKDAPQPSPSIVETQKTAPEPSPLIVETQKTAPELSPLIDETQKTAPEPSPLIVETQKTAPELSPLIDETQKTAPEPSPLIVETQKTAPEPSPMTVETKEEPPPLGDISEKETESSGPSDMIDRILKKKKLE